MHPVDLQHHHLTALADPPELDRKTISLKTCYTGVRAHGEFQLKLVWKVPPYRLGFIMLEGTMHASSKTEKWWRKYLESKEIHSGWILGHFIQGRTFFS